VTDSNTNTIGIFLSGLARKFDGSEVKTDRLLGTSWQSSPVFGSSFPTQAVSAADLISSSRTNSRIRDKGSSQKTKSPHFLLKRQA
jgi:hypothetical protein